MRISRVSLHEEVLERIRTMIIEQRWSPGTRFPETEVCEELGVSRTPLREALKVLASEGLIELKTNRGADIRVFSAKETNDTLMLIGELEAIAAKILCERITDEQISTLHELHEQMLDFHDKQERQNYWTTNQLIHDKILEYSDNHVLHEMHKLLRARMLPAMYAGSNQSDYEDAAVEEHEQIMQAIAERHGKRLATVLREHQSHTWERIRHRIQDKETELCRETITI